MKEYSLIRKTREAIGDSCEPVKLSVFLDELAVYITEKEFGISVFPKESKVVLDVEGYDWQLNPYQVQLIGKVMDVLYYNMKEIAEWTESIDG